ncbi:MAG: cyclase family protein [Candidatus Thermoplasmatota archaeon]|nr:cyclase family protein [Candidatus Thermoplasmatota archaeon]
MSEWFEDDSPWYPSKFGSDDILGTLNYLSPDKIISAVKLVRHGLVIRLSHEIYNGMPGRDTHGPFYYLHSQRAYDVRPPLRQATRNKFGGALCRIETSDHMATHLDSLNHISFDGKFYNGIDSYENSTVYGSLKLGIESVPPIVTRGIVVALFFVIGGALCRIETSDHMATHLDSLNHISFDGKFYNGIDSYENSTVYGSLKLGIESVPPIVTRGIVVDCTDSGKIMEPGEPIAVERVEKFLDENELKVREGDAVFFHTGVSSFWNNPQKYNTYYDRSPGIGMELAKWISDRGVSVTGSDTPATEVSPPEIDGTRLPVHQYLITKSGIRLIDNINTQEAASKKVYQFLFVCAPLRIRGATASPVVPLAIY